MENMAIYTREIHVFDYTYPCVPYIITIVSPTNVSRQRRNEKKRTRDAHRKKERKKKKKKKKKNYSSCAVA